MPPRRGRRSSTALQSAGWVLTGAALSLGLLGAFTIGPFALLVAVVLIAVNLRLGGANASAVGTVAGVGVILLYVAWLNRDGPGDVCVTTGTGGECTSEWSPWPWIGAGVLLIAAAPTAFALALRHRQRAEGGPSPG